jgi:hypothetical protein
MTRGSHSTQDQLLQHLGLVGECSGGVASVGGLKSLAGQ